MNDLINIVFKKYLVAAIIAVLGLVLFFYGLKEGNHQNALFLTASANIFIGGVLAILLSSGILKRGIVIGLAFLCGAITILIGYQSYTSVNATIKHIDARKKSELQTIQALTEIKEIQKAFKESKGRYAANFDELKEFFNTGTVTKVESAGSVPEYQLQKEEKMYLYNANPPSKGNMTELEAYRLVYEFNNPTNIPGLQGFRRDTVQVSFKKEFLANKSFKSNRISYGMGPFDIDQIKFIPYTNNEKTWNIVTKDSAIVSQDTMPVIRVFAEEPVSKYENGTKDTIGFGDLSTGALTGTWE